MTHKKSYCIHCGVMYYYQGSGQGCFDPINDPKHCPECMGVINEALSKVPKKIEKRWIDSTEYTFTEIVKLLDEYNAAEDKKYLGKRDGSLLSCLVPVCRPRRIFPGLIKVDTGECQESRYGVIKDSEYIVSWFKSDPKDYHIHKRVYWDLINDRALENY
jgi:copper chaperone CopZ